MSRPKSDPPKSKGFGVRFAPSPTGRFHIGNLRTAWVAATLARNLNEPFVVRVEDIDTPRVLPDAWNSQLHDLKRLGLVPDEIVIQSARYGRHLAEFMRARAEGRIYPCDCSRKDVQTDLAEMGRAPHTPLVSDHSVPTYSGHCRHRSFSNLAELKPVETLAWRWKDVDASGTRDQIVARTNAIGELFVPGYHWACAIDDADGGYHMLVRAWDLAPADLVQRQIRSWISASPAALVFHTSLVIRADGGRLEKRTQGVTLDELIASGITVPKLLESFAESFDIGSGTGSGSAQLSLSSGEQNQTVHIQRFISP